MTTLIFLASGALAGLAGATDLVGSLGSLQANWTPDYGMTVVPIVFLSRLNGWTVIVAVFVFSMLSIGSRSASLLLGVPLYYNLAFVGLLLIFFALIEYLDKRRQLKMV
jgi:simple sugar transport system permease protein